MIKIAKKVNFIQIGMKIQKEFTQQEASIKLQPDMKKNNHLNMLIQC